MAKAAKGDTSALLKGWSAIAKFLGLSSAVLFSKSKCRRLSHNFRIADHSDIDPVKSMHSLKSRVMCRAEPLVLNRTIDKPKQSLCAA
jgi:hypothetical protein